MPLEKKKDIQNQEQPVKYSGKYQNLLYEFISAFNSKDFTPDKIHEFRTLAANIHDNEVKKALLIDKLCGDNYLAKIMAIEVLAPYLLNDEKVRTLLLDGLKNNHSSVKKVIITKLVSLMDNYKEIESAILNLITNQYEASSVKVLIIKVLTSKLYRRDLRDIVTSRLKDVNGNVRIAAIQALSYYSDNIEVLDNIQSMLHDKDESVRIATIKSLGSKSNREDIKRVIITKLLEKNETQAVKEAALYSLAVYLGDAEEIQEYFIEIFFNNNNSSIRDLAKDLLFKNVPIELLQDLFVSRLVLEKSSKEMKVNVRNKLKKLTSKPKEDILDDIIMRKMNKK